MASEPTIKAALKKAGEATREKMASPDTCLFALACEIPPCGCAGEVAAAAIAAFLSRAADTHYGAYGYMEPRELLKFVAAEVEEAARDE